MTDVKVLPATLYDKLREKAYWFGGIGSGSLSTGDYPCCLYGIAGNADGIAFPNVEFEHLVYTPRQTSELAAPITRALNELKLDYRLVDAAIWRLRDALKLATNSRVPFDELAEELHLVRGS